MNAPLMVKVADRLVGAGFGVLRFNFRGVGGSSGHHDGGVGELEDVAAAMAAARRLAGGRPTVIAGWSFGAAVALRWQAHGGDDSPYAGIAPAVANPFSPSLPTADELAPARRGFVIGDRDQYTSVSALTTYAESIGAEVTVLAGSDHFFFFREEQVADAVAAMLESAREG